MFERFTDRSRRVVVLAQEVSREHGHDYIGTEHLLAGLAAEGEGVAAVVLAEHGLTAERVSQFIEAGPGTPSGHIPFTKECKQALELALREALQLGHNYIGTEHLLLGLLRQVTNQPDIVLGIFGAHGVSLADARQAVIKKLTAHAEADKNRRAAKAPPPPEQKVSPDLFRGRVVAIDFEATPPRLTVELLSDSPVGAWDFIGHRWTP